MIEIQLFSELFELFAGLPLAVGILGKIGDFLFGKDAKKNKYQQKASSRMLDWATQNMPDPNYERQSFQDMLDQSRLSGGDFGRDWDLYGQGTFVNPMMINADDIIGKYGNIGYELGDFGTYGDSEINQYITDANEAQQQYLTDQANQRFNQGSASLGSMGLMSSSAMNNLAETNQRNLSEDMNRYGTQANLEGLGMWLGDKNRHYDRLYGMQGAKMGHAFNTAYQNQGADLQGQMFDESNRMNMLGNRLGMMGNAWMDAENKRYMDNWRGLQAMGNIAGQPIMLEPGRSGIIGDAIRGLVGGVAGGFGSGWGQGKGWQASGYKGPGAPGYPNYG